MTDAAQSMTDDVQDLYRELILDHSRHPRHFGKLEGATHEAEGINPLCGDKIRLYLRLGSNDSIEDASFEGSGCAISVASASLLTDRIIGVSAEQARALSRQVICRLTDPELQEDEVQELDKIRALDGVRQFPSRVKCATLAWHAFESAIAGHSSPVTTE